MVTNCRDNEYYDGVFGTCFPCSYVCDRGDALLRSCQKLCPEVYVKQHVKGMVKDDEEGQANLETTTTECPPETNEMDYDSAEVVFFFITSALGCLIVIISVTLIVVCIRNKKRGIQIREMKFMKTVIYVFGKFKLSSNSSGSRSDSLDRKKRGTEGITSTLASSALDSRNTEETRITMITEDTPVSMPIAESRTPPECTTSLLSSHRNVPDAELRHSIQARNAVERTNDEETTLLKMQTVVENEEAPRQQQDQLQRQDHTQSQQQQRSVQPEQHQQQQQLEPHSIGPPSTVIISNSSSNNRYPKVTDWLRRNESGEPSHQAAVHDNKRKNRPSSGYSSGSSQRENSIIT